MNLTALDFICIALVIGTGMIGYYKGAINTLISLVGFIASFVIARIFSGPLTNWLLSVNVVKDFINNTVTSNVLSAITNYSNEAIASIQGVLGLENITGSAIQAGGSTAADAINQALQPIVYQITNLLVFAVILLICSFLFGFIRRIGKGVNRIPVIGIANRICGFGLGAVIGLMVAGLVIAIVLYYGIFTGNMDIVQMVTKGVFTGSISVYLH